MSYALWKQRNEALHASKNHFDEHRIDIVRLDLDILEEHRMGIENLPTPDLRLVQGITVEDLLEKPVARKVRWLRSVRLARDAFVAAADALLDDNDEN